MQSIKKQAGSMLMSALFIAILMLALGVALVNILSSSAHNNAVEYYGARALLAGQSGIEWALVEIFELNPDSDPAVANQASVDACNNFDDSAPKTLTYSDPYLLNCSAKIICNAIEDIPDSSVSTEFVNVFRISSSATCSISNCAAGHGCRKDFWQTQRTINVEAKTLN
ncbi:hypothetical protein CJF42_01795 [Pseudoalteromonas sp. NBT06-2]|uniref:agglutinin biogenesis protein MshP n=1 Tax=Pseudoalteromonas sp. NBT06-2 TaxID=2025950 RepID=UPI000BA54F3F|nr:agglutinin biogenesis protein MshP [Pseudoalteromonas sp. NBT06-2]PAJ75996.1 hypothetical protein CJF42_01795 [Pseudoalteromonas sp. NBT06-2]